MTILRILWFLIVLTLYAYGCYKVGYYYGKADGLKEIYKSKKEDNP